MRTDIFHGTFTHKRFYTHRLLHADALHADTFARKHLYIQTLLHTDAFTRRSFYTQRLLHRDAFTQRRAKGVEEDVAHTHMHTKGKAHTRTRTHRHRPTHTHKETDTGHTNRHLDRHQDTHTHTRTHSEVIVVVATSAIRRGGEVRAIYLHTLAQKHLIELLMWNASYVHKHFV